MLITDPTELRKYEARHRIWQGIPGIARTKKGRTFLSFYSGGTKETYGNYAAVIKSDTDTDFSEPILVAKKPGCFRCFDPVLWIDPLGRLWFIWNVMPGEEVFASVCDDPDAESLSWSEAFYIGRGVMMNKPLVLSSGDWLFPIAFWLPQLHHAMRKSDIKPDDIPGSYVYKTADNGRTFVKLGMADVRNRSFDEHMLIEHNSGVLQMLVRTNYGIGVSYSYDRGKNWSAGADSGLAGPCSRFFLSRLRSGRILLINHFNFQGRNNLTAMLSEDEGKTFPYTLLLDARSSVSYPDAVECEDGYIYIVYDRERGDRKSSVQEACTCARELLTAKITEQDILNGELSSKDSFLRSTACKLGTLEPDDPDPYLPAVEDREFAEALISGGSENIIEAIFMRHSVSCSDYHLFRRERLDARIQRFLETGGKDVEQLTKIIGLIRSAGEKPLGRSPLVEAVTDWIERNIAEDISVASLAEQLQTSRYYLSHLFKAETGISISEYRNELRLTKAKQMLIHSNATISQIAQQTGYCSPSYFSEVFLKNEKVTPSLYRQYHSLTK